jgi:hypothetical protein
MIESENVSLAVSVGAQDHAQGSPDAPVTLLEYGDYQRPDCGAAHAVVPAVSMLTFALERTNVLLGAVHMLLFLAYLMLIFQK